MIQITQTKFSKISNLIFLTFCAFVISFVWLNKYISNIKLSTISSIIIALFFFVTYIVFKYFQNKFYTQNNNQKISIEELKNQLEEAEYNLDKAEREYSELQDKYNLLKSEKENEDKI